MIKQAPVVVMGSASATFLGVVRGFGRRGIPVIALTNSPINQAPNLSRYIAHLEFVDRWDGDDIYRVLEALENFQTSDKPLVVLPTNDASLLGYLSIREDLSPKFIDFLPNKDLLFDCLFKDRFNRRLAGLNVERPWTLRIASQDELEDLDFQALSYPLVVKPVLSHVFVKHFQRKLFQIDNEIDLRRTAKTVLEQGNPILLQSFIPGSEFYQVCFYAEDENEIWMGESFQKIRQYPSDHGVGTLVIQKRDDQVLEIARKIATHLNFSGIGEMEFKRHPQSGRNYLLEINPRPVTFNRLIAQTAFDSEYLYYRKALGLLTQNDLMFKNGAGDIGWLDMKKDLSGVLVNWRQLSRGFYFWKIREQAYFALDDLKPFLMDWWQFLARGAKQIFKRK